MIDVYRSSDLSGDKFESLIHFKCLRALADPGEAVGLLAAQVLILNILIVYTISRYDQLFVILDSHQINFHQLAYYTHFTVSLILTVYRRTIHSDDPKYLPLCWQGRNECHPGHPSSEVHYITGESTESLAYFSLWLMSRS